MSRPMGIPLFMHRDDDEGIRPDPFAAHREGIDAAIQAREAAIIAEGKAKQSEGIRAREAAKRRSLAVAAERRIFNQVANVGGVRHAK